LSAPGSKWCRHHVLPRDHLSSFGIDVLLFQPVACLAINPIETHVVAQGRGRIERRYLLADKGYDADQLRRSLRDAGAVPVIPGRRSRKRAICYDKERYRDRHLIENAFCRLKDFRRVHTRYDKLAVNFLSGVALATAIAFWL
jgi:transposase